jgi:NADH-quinone oxidoreductase subunit E/NADP-reducing hydrogenase subunit HndA
MQQEATAIDIPSGRIEVIAPEELDRIDEIVVRYSREPEYLIPALKDAQEIFGYLPMEVQDKVAEGFHISPSRVYGVVTFYSFFTLTPRGRNTVRVCLGTACYVKRSKEILETLVNEIGIEVGQTSEDGRFTIEAVRCLGTCGLAPVMLVGNEAHGNLDPRRVGEILRRYR